VAGLVAGEDVVIVTGPPGTGKTTIVRMLADAQVRSVHLESDWFYRFIRAGFIPPHLPASRPQNDAVMDLVGDVAIGYARNGYVVFWDGIVGPWYLDRVLARLAAGGVRVHYVPLRASRSRARARVRRRDGTTADSGADVMYEHMSDFGALEHLVVSTDGPARKAMLEIQDGLEAGRFRVG
jgi:predicted kinase